MILENSIQAVKETSAVDVIGHYVDLKKRGANYIAHCPFHEERTPSFHVNPSRNAFKCFGCGKGGDAIAFVMEYESKTFIEAVELIAGISNIQLDVEKRTISTKRTKVKNKRQPIEFDVIPQSEVNKIVDQGIEFNFLTDKLQDIFGKEVVLFVLKQYSISTKGNWLTFPQIDSKGNWRTGKAIKYKNNGHRDDSFNPLWLHNLLIQKGLLKAPYKLKQCFTGEHLINQSFFKPIAIVEGQSTMLFMACISVAATMYNIPTLEYFNQFTWICTGGSDGIGWKSEFVTNVLKGRKTILFPDAGFYTQWNEDAEIMQDLGIDVCVSDFIEKKHKQGILNHNEDLRDYLMKYADEIKAYCQPIQINSDSLTYKGETITGKDFNNVKIVSVWSYDGKKYRVLFDKEGEYISVEESVKDLSKFFCLDFSPAMIDGNKCLINISNN